MSLKALFLVALSLAASYATCGTHCGGCTATCVNNPSFTCTDCGTKPCVDTTQACWSCAGSDSQCYPYDCGTTCSTAPCTTVEALANGVSKYNGTTAAVGFAPPPSQKAAPTTSKTNSCCSIVNNICCPPGNSCEAAGMACSCDPSQCAADSAAPF